LFAAIFNSIAFQFVIDGRPGHPALTHHLSVKCLFCRNSPRKVMGSEIS
jgi:hypothetical protein